MDGTSADLCDGLRRCPERGTNWCRYHYLWNRELILDIRWRYLSVSSRSVTSSLIHWTKLIKSSLRSFTCVHHMLLTAVEIPPSSHTVYKSIGDRAFDVGFPTWYLGSSERGEPPSFRRDSRWTRLIAIRG